MRPPMGVTTVSAEAETVFVPQASTSDGSRVYHTDPACRYVTKTMQTWERTMAEAWELRPCRRCSEASDK